MKVLKVPEIEQKVSDLCLEFDRFRCLMRICFRFVFEVLQKHLDL